MVTIREWLENLGLERYASAPEENNITLDLAPDLRNRPLITAT